MPHAHGPKAFISPQDKEGLPLLTPTDCPFCRSTLGIKVWTLWDSTAVHCALKERDFHFALQRGYCQLVFIQFQFRLLGFFHGTPCVASHPAGGRDVDPEAAAANAVVLQQQHHQICQLLFFSSGCPVVKIGVDLLLIMDGRKRASGYAEPAGTGSCRRPEEAAPAGLK